VNCDQAHGLLGLERAEAFLHLAGGQAVAARADQFDADQVAILRAAGVSGRNGEFAAGLLLVDGDHAAVAIWHQAEDSENAVGGLVEQFDHAAAIGLVVLAVGLFNAQQGAIANTGNGAGRCTARHMDPNNRGGPSTSSSHSAGAASILHHVAARDVRDDGGRKRFDLPHLLALFGNRAFVGKLAQDTPQRCTDSFFNPKCRASSRVPASPGCALTNAIMLSRSGKAVVASLFFFIIRVLYRRSSFRDLGDLGGGDFRCFGLGRGSFLQ
jgi:hypothetical protein